MNLEQLDTSFWLTKDKAWVAERKAKWQDIEPGIALGLTKAETNMAKAEQDIFDMLGYEHFLFFSNWLLQDLTSIFCRDCLYQYPDVLDWCMTTLKYDAEFIARIQKPSALASYHKALYRIAHFDLEQEGDTPRANAVRYLHELIEQGDFLPEFKQLWQQVKAGEVAVEKPWQRF